MTRFRRIARAGALLLLGGALGACGDAGTVAEPRLAGGTRSLDALGAAVWNGIVARDTAALGRLRLSEYEHNELVWPEQPAAREPSAAENLDFWWQNIERRNRAALEDLFATFGDSGLTVRGVQCVGAPRSYETFTALADCHLLLEGPGGLERVQAFRHVVVMDGVHKVVRYDQG